MALLDAIDDRGVLGGGSDRLGHLLELVVGPEQVFGCGPQAVLFDVGELADECRALRAGGEVARFEAKPAAGPAQVDTGVAQEVDAPSGLVNSVLTSTALSMSTTRWRPPSGRNTARCRPSSWMISAWTPVRLLPSAPISSPVRPSRSTLPTPAITVSRGCIVRVNEFDPAWITNRS